MNADRPLEPLTVRIAEVAEGPPRTTLVLRQPRRGRNLIIYHPGWPGAATAGYESGRWYYRIAGDWTTGPRSRPFGTAEEAIQAALRSPDRPADVPVDPVDDDGGEGELEPDENEPPS